MLNFSRENMACLENTQNYILQDHFCSYPSLSPCRLCLTEEVLFIKNSNKTDLEDIKITDIVGCQSIVKKPDKWKKDQRDISSYLRVYYYPLRTSSGLLYKQLRRERQVAKFVMSRFETYEDNASVVNKWRRAILWLLRREQVLINGEVKIPESLPIPQKLLFIVNPHSGPGKAALIFKEQVVPILVESDIQYEVLVTDRANCARNYVKSADLSRWNGIVVVSGDGLLFEVYNGLMERLDWENAVKMPLGVIPGGSGNGLARAICYATGEPYDTNIVTSSVLNVVHGRISPMDLVRVDTAYGSIYSFLSIGWGLMADIDIESEKLRAIGEARFTIWAVIRALGLRTYKGKLSYLPVLGYNSQNCNKTLLGPKMKRSKTIGSQQLHDSNSTEPLFRSKSFGSEALEIPLDDTKVELLQFSYISDFSQCNGPDTQCMSTAFCSDKDNHSKVCEISKSDISAESSELETKECLTSCPASSIPPLTEPVPENWVILEGEFVLVYVCHQTHLSTDVLFAPDAKLDDGIMWLIVIRSGVSRAKVIYFLSSLQTGDHVHIPYVDVIPIHAFRLEPFKTDGVLTVDGEVIPCSTIQAEVLPSVARIMTR